MDKTLALTEIRLKGIDRFLDEHILCRQSHIFSLNPAGENLFFQHISQSLNVDPANIIIVGSAKTGISMSPSKFGRQFLPESDIDVIVISPSIYDDFWLTIAEFAYPHKSVIDSHLRTITKDVMRQFFWGSLHVPSLTPYEITYSERYANLRDYRSQWFTAFKGLSKYYNYPEFSARTVKGRLYRSLEHAKMYHRSGVQEIMRQQIEV
ncbi:hypothetical protein [Deinococcus kurensis]|uniref:hypothetical protein n=1 Tax=Deinococcus kurensis TaxID=2662757 RepID=UPI0012D31600|nr:hypothetical protein [Deinococcus kurensis]